MRTIHQEQERSVKIRTSRQAQNNLSNKTSLQPGNNLSKFQSHILFVQLRYQFRSIERIGRCIFFGQVIPASRRYAGCTRIFISCQ